MWIIWSLKFGKLQFLLSGKTNKQISSHLYLTHFQHLANSQTLIWDDTYYWEEGWPLPGAQVWITYMGLENPLITIKFLLSVKANKQTIIKSPLPVTFSTLSQFSDFDLRWYLLLRRRLAITRSTSVDYMGLENPLTMSSLYLILTSIIFPVLAISWLCCIALCIYKGLLKNLRLRPGRNTKVQVIFSLCWLYTWLCCIFLCIYKGLLKILRLGPCRSTRVQVMFYL